MLYVVKLFNITDFEDAYEPTSLCSPAIRGCASNLDTTETLTQALSTDVNDAALRWCGVHLAYFDATGAQPSISDAGWMFALCNTLHSTAAFEQGCFSMIG